MQVKSRFDELFQGAARAELEMRLVSYIGSRRWFRSKTRALAAVTVQHVVPLPIDGIDVALTVLRLRYAGHAMTDPTARHGVVAEGGDDEYVLPLTWVHGETGERLVQARPHLVIGAVEVDGAARPCWLVDALGERHALEGWLALVARGATVRADSCTVSFRRVDAAPGALDAIEASPSPVEAEQSNTSVVFGHACILKVLRKLENGVSPDLEMGEFLTHAGFANTPRLLAAIELARAASEAVSVAPTERVRALPIDPASETATVGVVHAFVPNEGDAWSFTLARIARAAGNGELSAVEDSYAFVRPLATRIAEMHAALARPTSDPRFSPEPLERAEREAMGEAVEQSLDAAWSLVDERASGLSAETQGHLRAARSRAGAYRDCIARFVEGGFPCVKTRVHGDLHLGQVLVSGDDFVLIDFEGEPARPLAQRKTKRSPAVDVAGMLRSLHYASVAAASPQKAPPLEVPIRAFTESWHRVARREFLRAYHAASASRSVLPEDADAREVLLRFCLLEKCVYELHYELNNRPDWVAIPLLGLESVLEVGHEA